MTFRCDRLAWAYAILSDKVWWCFHGIEHPAAETIRWMNNPNVPSREKNKLAATLLGDEHYTGNLIDEELKYQFEDGVYDDEWEEEVRDTVHRDDCCPNSRSEKERTKYKERFDTLLKDAERKQTWLRDRFDYDWHRDLIMNDCTEPSFVERFLEQHSISGVIGSEFHFVPIDQIVGYCPKCCEPVETKHFEVIDSAGSLRMFHCENCSETISTDDRWGDVFLQKWGHPFNWPPGAPYPPRRCCCGQPSEAPPWEK